MKLFNKSKDKAARGSSHVEIFHSEDNETALAFGVQWVSIVTNNGRAVETKRARKRGATHVIATSQQCGFGAIASDVISTLVNVRVYPAAQVMAHQHGGDALHFLRLTDTEYWICVVRNATPTSVDRFVTTDIEATAVKEASEILQAAQENGTTLTVFSNVHAPELGHCRPTSLEDMFLVVGSDSDLFIPITKPSFDVPKPVIAVLVLGLIGLLAQQGFRYYKKFEYQRFLQMSSVDKNIPPAEAWAKAVETWQATTASPSMAELQEVRESMGKAPAIWKGWMLSQVTCTAGLVSPGSSQPKPAADQPASGTVQEPLMSALQRTWSCNASYERSPFGAYNSTMVSAIPSDWAVTFVPINKMQVTWSRTVKASNVKVADLAPPASHFVGTVSKLQKIGGILSQDMALQFAAVVIPAPLRDDKKPYPADPSTPQIQQAKLTFKAPLRSLDVILKEEFPISWTSINLTVAPLGSSQSTLKTSPLTTEVNGVIYAKNK